MATGRSRHILVSARGYLGKIPKLVWHVVEMAHIQGFSVSSNAAREFAYEIALAASMGWITVVRLDGKVALRFWNITAEGLHALHNKDNY